jgi:hypothetical protein
VQVLTERDFVELALDGQLRQRDLGLERRCRIVAAESIGAAFAELGAAVS